MHTFINHYSVSFGEKGQPFRLVFQTFPYGSKKVLQQSSSQIQIFKVSGLLLSVVEHFYCKIAPSVSFCNTLFTNLLLERTLWWTLCLWVLMDRRFLRAGELLGKWRRDFVCLLFIFFGCLNGWGECQKRILCQFLGRVSPPSEVVEKVTMKV